MSVVDDLIRARDAYERREWLDAYGELGGIDPDAMEAGDFLSLGTVAHLLGHHNDCVQALQRAYQAHVSDDDPGGAIRCACWLTRVLMRNGEEAVGAGWAARARRLLETLETSGDVVERGYVAIVDMFGNISAGQFDAAAALAPEIERCGRRFDDPDLVAMGLTAQGRLMLYSGRVPDGIALLDEAMAFLAAGEVSTVFAGEIYCTMIEGCQEISDVGRAAEWTAALTAWCDAQPGLVAFTGQCAVHRGQIMRQRGAYKEALVELDRAVQRYLEMGTEAAAGLSFEERGDVLRVRGDLPDAESAYEEAIALGHDPQPGLALLWSAQGRVDAATGAIRRIVAEPRDPVHRSQILPAAVEILLDAGAIDEAAELSSELVEIADAFQCDGLQAMSSHSAACVALAREAPSEALTHSRDAMRRWNELDAPYETALARVVTGRALSALGDEPSAKVELRAAQRTFAKLGTVRAEVEVAKLLSRDSAGGLSPREAEVLRLVARGNSNRAIAESLVISEKTVARHLSNIFAKLGVTSRTAAAAYAFEHGVA